MGKRIDQLSVIAKGDVDPAADLFALHDTTGYGSRQIAISEFMSLFRTPFVVTMHTSVPARLSETHWNGALRPIAVGQALNSGAPLGITKGTGKLVIVVNAGGDLSGEILVNGTTVDRNTGVETGADIDIITVDAVTTDGSTTDSNGNVVNELTGAYITSMWFTGSVTLTTTNLSLTDIDVYEVAFEQFNDSADIIVTTLDVTLLTTNAAAEFDAYLYTLRVTGSKCYVGVVTDVHLGADGPTAIADRFWRLRRGNINEALDGTTDGVWVDIFYANTPIYVEDVTVKLWASVPASY